MIDICHLLFVLQIGNISNLDLNDADEAKDLSDFSDSDEIAYNAPFSLVWFVSYQYLRESVC